MHLPLRSLRLPLLGAALLGACGDDQPATSATTTATDGPASTSLVTATTTDPTGTTVTPTTGDATTTSISGTGTGTTATGDDTSGGSTVGLTDTSATDTGTTTTIGPDTTGTDTGTTADNTTGMPCADGTIVCDGNDKKVCDGVGGFKDEETCPGFCLEDVGCVACEPGSFKCAGDVVQQCDDQGGGYADIETCDPIQGVTCDADMGQCAGACAAGNLGLSYIGCDYYPTVTAGLQETNPWVFHYAVVVANTTNQVAKVTITQGANMITTDTVAANTAKAITLPYVPALGIPNVNTTGPSVKVADGAYRLRSDQPVTVYQYQPLEYKIGNSFSYINDAGLLLPVNTWGLDYRVVSRNHWNFGPGVPGFYAVVAAQDGTKVTLTPSVTGKIVAAGGGVAADGSGVVMLDQGDVLEVFTKSGGGNPDVSDLTGTHVESDKPVQVIGGHKCSNIPFNVQFCDRIEESIPPTTTLAKEYIVSAPLINANLIKNEMVRMIATEDDTALTYEPPQAGAPTMLAKAGDYAEIAQTNKDFRVTGDKKIIVAQYMIGQNGGGNAGDPAMALAVATEQFRTQYLVHAPTNYDSSWANLVAPMGAAVTVDGNPINNFTAIGNTGYGVARISLSNAGDGNHLAQGDKPFGIMVYGYGQYTSYWYPGGLDLNFVPQ